MSETPILSVHNLAKRYGGVIALEDMNLRVERGVIHAIVGENGAGKSTLMKALAGVVRPDGGVIEIEGAAVAIESPGAARNLGIVKPGTARVRIDLLSQPEGTRPIGTPIRYYVQVGSYSQPTNARRVSSKLAAYYSDVKIDEVSAGARSFYRVRMGSFATRDEARERANDSARFGYPIVIVSE